MKHTLSLLIVFIVAFAAMPLHAESSSDLNQDGCVDAADLNIVSSVFKQPNTTMGDISGDGVVDVDDMSFVMRDWDEDCVPTVGSSKMNLYGDVSFEKDDPNQPGPGISDAQLDFTANRYDMMQIGFSKGHLKRIKDFNAELLALRYMNGTQAPKPCKNQDPAQCDENDPENWDPIYVCAANHNPQLFWIHESGEKVIETEFQNYLIDIQDPVKRDGWVGCIIENLNDNMLFVGQNPEYEYDGVMFDIFKVYDPANQNNNISPGLPGQSAQSPIDRETYYLALNNILSQVDDAYPDKTIIVNSMGKNEVADIGYSGLELLDSGADGLMEESYALRAGSGLRWGKEDYLERIAFFNSASHRGSHNITIQNDDRKYSDSSLAFPNRIFSAATYFLYSTDASYYSYNNSHLFGAAPQHYPEWDLDIGAPQGEYQIEQSVDGHDIVTRDFQNGKIIVNPDPNVDVTVNIGTNQYQSAFFSGGGHWLNDAEGTITWQDVNGQIELTDVDVLILKKK